MRSHPVFLGFLAGVVAVALNAAAPAGRALAQDTTATAVPAPAPALDTTAVVAPAPDPSRTAAVPADSVIVVDRVVAVVGNRPVLASQVDEELFSRQAQGANLPTAPEQLDSVRREVVSSIVDEELLVQQAARDTAIQVTDQEVADGVEQQVRKVRGNFTSEVDYRNELKKAGFQTPEEYRRWLTDQQRRAALQNRLIDGLRSSGKLKPVAPTEQEMRKFFEHQKGNLGSVRRRSRSGRSWCRRSRARRPRPGRERRPTRSCSSSAAGRTSPPRRAGSPRTPLPPPRAGRSTGFAAG